MAKDPAKANASLREHMPESDKAVLDDPAFSGYWGENLKEMGRHGMRGAVQTIALEGRPWGFTLEEIKMKVHVFHGESDSLAFPLTAQYVAERLRDCELHMYAGDGHLACVANRAEDVVKTLIG